MGWYIPKNMNIHDHNTRNKLDFHVIPHSLTVRELSIKIYCQGEAPGGSLRKNVWRQGEVCEKTSGVQRVKTNGRRLSIVL